MKNKLLVILMCIFGKQLTAQPELFDTTRIKVETKEHFIELAFSYEVKLYYQVYAVDDSAANYSEAKRIAYYEFQKGDSMYFYCLIATKDDKVLLDRGYRITQFRFEYTADEKGIRNGICNYYIGDSILFESGYFKNGMADGLWRMYYPSGQIMQIRNFKEGKAHGVGCYFTLEGKMRWHDNYKNGREDGWKTVIENNSGIESMTFYKKGEKRTTLTFKP